MECKEVQKNIPAFLNDELTGKAAELFLNHIEECPECREELSIQYLVRDVSYKKIKNQRRAAMAIYSLEFIAMIAVIFILVLVFTNK